MVSSNEFKFNYLYRFSKKFCVCISASTIKDPSNCIEIISLRNPSTEKVSKYLHVKEKQQFFEVLSFSEEPRSWFVNDAVHPNGQLYITSPFDPLFWALYYIRMNNTERAQPIDQTIIDNDFASANILADILTVEQLSMVRKCFDYDYKNY